MARKAGRRKSSGGTRTMMVKAAAPNIRVTVPRPAKEKRSKGRRHHIGGSIQTKMIAGGIGGFVLGYVDKHFPNLPTIPIAGKAGTIAIVAYFVGKNTRMKMAYDVAVAAATVSGYEFGFSGKISGDNGIATQT